MFGISRTREAKANPKARAELKHQSQTCTDLNQLTLDLGIKTDTNSLQSVGDESKTSSVGNNSMTSGDCNCTIGNHDHVNESYEKNTCTSYAANIDSSKRNVTMLEQVNSNIDAQFKMT